MIFYHYTGSHHIDAIQETQVLQTTESNLHHEIEHYGPDVVWLFKEPLGDKTPEMMKAKAQLSGATVFLDKAQYEIKVDLPPSEVMRADKFFKRFHDDLNYAELLLRALEKTGGSKAKTWYVIQRPIPSEEWVGIKERPHHNRVTRYDGFTVRPRKINIETTPPPMIVTDERMVPFDDRPRLGGKVDDSRSVRVGRSGGLKANPTGNRKAGPMHKFRAN